MKNILGTKSKFEEWFLKEYSSGESVQTTGKMANAFLAGRRSMREQAAKVAENGGYGFPDPGFPVAAAILSIPED